MEKLVSDAAAALGVTERELAQLLGVSRNTVSRWKHGRMGMEAPTAVLLGLIASTPPSQREATRRRLEALQRSRRPK